MENLQLIAEGFKNAGDILGDLCERKFRDARVGGIADAFNVIASVIRQYETGDYSDDMELGDYLAEQALDNFPDFEDVVCFGEKQ